MTPQEIADYAMDYLDSKGIAAEYEISRWHVKVCIDDCVVLFFGGESKRFIRSMLERAYLTNRK